MRSSNLNFNSRERGVYARDNEEQQGDSNNNSLYYYQRRLGPLSIPLLTDDPSNPDLLQKRIRIYSTVILVTSLFFWSWAMYNTRHLQKSNKKALDLGIFSFFGTALSSLFMLRMAYGGNLLVCCKRRGKMTNNEQDDDGLYLETHRRKSSRNVVDHCPPGGFLLRFTLTTQLIVVINYLLGLMFAMTAGKRVYVYFATYCSIFSILWLIIAFCCWNIVSAYREAIRITLGDEYVNKKSKHRNGCRWLCNYLLAYCYRKLVAKQNRDDDEINVDEEDEEVDEELRALYAGPGKKGYLNINY